MIGTVGFVFLVNLAIMLLISVCGLKRKLYLKRAKKKYDKIMAVRNLETLRRETLLKMYGPPRDAKNFNDEVPNAAIGSISERNESLEDDSIHVQSLKESATTENIPLNSLNVEHKRIKLDSALDRLDELDGSDESLQLSSEGNQPESIAAKAKGKKL